MIRSACPACVTRQARDELRGLIKTCQLPADTRERVSRSLLVLEGWLIVVYMYIEDDDRVVIIAFHDARISEVATARL